MEINVIQPQPSSKIITKLSDDSKVKVTFDPSNLSLAALNPILAELVFISKVSVSFTPRQKIDTNDIYRGAITLELQPNLKNSTYINQLKDQLTALNLSDAVSKMTLIPSSFEKLRLRAEFKTMSYTRLVQKNIRVQSSVFDHSIAPVELTLNYPIIAGKSNIVKHLDVELPFETSSEHPVTQSHFALDLFYRLSIDLNEAQFIV